MAETKNYLQMEPIIGNSKNPQYKKAVEIDSYDFGTFNAGSITLNMGVGDFQNQREQEIHLILSATSKAVGQFWMARPRDKFGNIDFASFDDGQQPVFKEALLTVEKVKGNQLKKIMIYKMSPVIVVDVLGEGNRMPGAVAQVTLRFKKMQYIIP